MRAYSVYIYIRGKIEVKCPSLPSTLFPAADAARARASAIFALFTRDRETERRRVIAGYAIIRKARGLLRVFLKADMFFSGVMRSAV